MTDNDTSAWLPQNTFRILIASDIHLGYLENDPVRGDDSFTAFEEVLTQAVQYDVDLILLGGDLFDQAKPSPNCMFKCTQIMRKYCFGDKPVHIELLSNHLENFSRAVNYEDPNLNVSYPILSIHGNHDDPVGHGSISSLDILSITGLVNYFGKWNDHTEVKISPVLMQKGSTRLALYGLSHLKDRRLAKLFAEKKVEMDLPDDSEHWFNMFVLHQNRADRGEGNYINERVLPNFLDLVVWGHEHDSLVLPVNGKKADSFYVLQPGSTVATSLAAGEALPKHCALLQIHEKEFTLTPIPLKTVRPFIFKTIVLSEEDLGDQEINEHEKVQEFLKGKIDEAIEEAKNTHSGDPKQPTLPLVRLSVLYERETQNFNKIRFGQNFNGLVANPNDILLMKKEKKLRDKKDRIQMEEMQLEEGAAVEAADVESLIQMYFESQPMERQLTVLSVKAMTEAVRDFTLKKDEDIFRRVFEAHKQRCIDSLLESTAETEEEINQQLQVHRQTLDAADSDEIRRLIDWTSKPKAQVQPVVLLKNLGDLSVKTVSPKRSQRASKKEAVVIVSSDEDVKEIPSRGRTRSGAKSQRVGAVGGGGGAGRGQGRGRGPRAAPSPPPPPERRTPRRAAQRSNNWLHNYVDSRHRTRSSDFDDSD